MNEIYKGTELIERRTLQEVSRGEAVPQISSTEYNKLREKYSVNWIIIDSKNKNIEEYLNETNSKNKIEIDGYLLYQY